MRDFFRWFEGYGIQTIITVALCVFLFWTADSQVHQMLIAGFLTALNLNGSLGIKKSNSTNEKRNDSE